MSEAHKQAALRRWRRFRASQGIRKSKPAARPYRSKHVMVKKASIDRLKRLVGSF